MVRADGAGYAARSEAFSTPADFVLTSYNNWAAKHTKGPQKGELLYPELSGKKWAAYIFDEGHRLRGRNSSWTKHVFRTRLSKAANKDTPLWILTGTPFVRNGGDFFSYFHLFDKKAYSSYWKFVNDRCVVVETPWAKQVGNIRKAYAADFRQELAAFNLRRTVSEIPQLSSLEFVENNYYVEMPKSVITMIKKAKKEYVLQHDDMASPQFLDGSGALYVAQRKIATVPPTKLNPKIEWLKDFLTDKRGKVIVWTWYRDSAKAVRDALGESASMITGGVPTRARHDIIEAWKHPDGPQVLVATIPSMNTGLTLTEASETVFLEHCELPSENQQAVARLCRRGQTKLVQVHHVWALGTVDIPIKKVIEGRESGMASALAKWVQEDEDTDDGDAWFT